MNDKDKEALNTWIDNDVLSQDEINRFKGMSEQERVIFVVERAWLAACAYKDAEIKKLREGCCCSAEEQYTCVKCRWERHEAD
jgi:hypothetical protein